MRKINFFGTTYTPDEWVRREVCKNAGACRNKSPTIKKDELTAWCDELGVVYKKSATKQNLFDLLLENGCSYPEIAVHFKIGVTSRDYKETFGLTQEQVKALEKNGSLKTIAQRPFKSSFQNKIFFASIYDLYQFCRMTNEEMKRLLER